MFYDGSLEQELWEVCEKYRNSLSLLEIVRAFGRVLEAIGDKWF